MRTVKQIKTIAGDTFDTLALEFLGDEKLASAIIKENPDYCDTLIFDEGVTLIVPESVDVTLPETLPPWRREE